MKKVVVIVGPTGSGKTGLSIRLARQIGAEIINGDSVQVYRNLDIGSAKIKEAEKQGIKHHLLDVCDLEDTYTVFQFQKDVRTLIDQIDIPIIVGGTGLYIKAALYQYEFIEKERDEAFEKKHEHLSNDALYQMLIDQDPDIHIDNQNRRRLLRALEQAYAGEYRSKKNKKDTLLYDALIIYLDLDRVILEQRLKARLEKQLQDGFIDEVLALKNRSIELNTIGYRELFAYLNQTCSLEEAKESIMKASKKLAKKQKTWFMNQMHPVVLDATSKTLDEEVMQHVNLFLKGELK